MSSLAGVAGFGPVFPALDFEALRALLARLSGEEAAVQRAQAKAWQLDAEAIQPVFRAASREEFWDVRDRMLVDPDHWFHLYSSAMQAIAQARQDLPVPEELIGGALDSLERSPPRFLSAAARRNLADGMHLVQRLLHLPGVEGAAIGAEMVKQVLEAPPRQRRIHASLLLSSMWAGLLMNGVRPQSDDVADSIAKGFANLVAGWSGLVQAQSSDQPDADDPSA